MTCRCAAEQIVRYQSRLSGPFLDRVDLHLQLQRETHVDGGLQSTAGNESSATIRERVRQARKRQMHRQGVSNAHLDAQALREHVQLHAGAGQCVS